MQYDCHVVGLAMWGPISFHANVSKQEVSLFCSREKPQIALFLALSTSFISPTKKFPQSQFQKDLFCTLLGHMNYFAMKMTSKLQNIRLFFLPSDSTRNSAILSRSQQGPSVSAKLTSDGHACAPY